MEWSLIHYNSIPGSVNIVDVNLVYSEKCALISYSHVNSLSLSYIFQYREQILHSCPNECEVKATSLKKRRISVRPDIIFFRFIRFTGLFVFSTLFCYWIVRTIPVLCNTFYFLTRSVVNLRFVKCYSCQLI